LIIGDEALEGAEARRKVKKMKGKRSVAEYKTMRHKLKAILGIAYSVPPIRLLQSIKR
jgi:hypothetical protein